MFKTIIILGFLCCSNCVFSQTVINQSISTSGDSFSNSMFAISWTLGDVLDGTFQTEDIIVVSGLQEIRIRKATLLKRILKSEPLHIFPNPANDQINITHSFSQNSDGYLKLIDFSGNVVLIEKLSDKRQNISLLNIADGPYILQITDNKNTTFKSMKIIKHNKGE